MATFYWWTVALVISYSAGLGSAVIHRRWGIAATLSYLAIVFTIAMPIWAAAWQSAMKTA